MVIAPPASTVVPLIWRVSLSPSTEVAEADFCPGEVDVVPEPGVCPSVNAKAVTITAAVTAMKAESLLGMFNSARVTNAGL